MGFRNLSLFVRTERERREKEGERERKSEKERERERDRESDRKLITKQFRLILRNLISIFCRL